MRKRKLHEKFELYIPSKTRDDTIENLLGILAVLAQGMTAAKTQGAYVPQPGRVMVEDVMVYTFYAPLPDSDQLNEAVDDLIEYLVNVKGEESVLLVVDGQAYLYEAGA